MCSRCATADASVRAASTVPEVPFVSLSDCSRSVMSDATIQLVEKAQGPDAREVCVAKADAILANAGLSGGKVYSTSCVFCDWLVSGSKALI